MSLMLRDAVPDGAASQATAIRVPDAQVMASRSHALALRIGFVVAALVVAALALAALGSWLGNGGPPPPRSPFGTGIREAAPAPGFMGGLGGQLIAWQSALFRELTQAVAQAFRQPAAAWTLISGSFLYGLVHAAGPGHGKMVISSYIIADGRGLRRGIALSIAAALLQACVAIALVAVMALVLRATAREVGAVTQLVETTAFAAIALAGLAVLWRKAGVMARLAADGTQLHGAEPCTPGCGHDHLPPPATLERIASWRELTLVVAAAGARPCMGAIVVLTFAASQGVFATGILAALAMAAGVAIATSALAILAVGFKALALRLAGGRGLAGTWLLLALEGIAAACVAALGLMLLLGLGASAGA